MTHKGRKNTEEDEEEEASEYGTEDEGESRGRRREERGEGWGGMRGEGLNLDMEIRKEQLPPFLRRYIKIRSGWPQGRGGRTFSVGQLGAQSAALF